MPTRVFLLWRVAVAPRETSCPGIEVNARDEERIEMNKNMIAVSLENEVWNDRISVMFLEDVVVLACLQSRVGVEWFK